MSEARGGVSNLNTPPPLPVPRPLRGGEPNELTCLHLGKKAEPGGNQLPSHCRGGVSEARGGLSNKHTIKKKNMHYKTAKANESEQKILRKELRSHATPAEAVLWKMLKGRNADGMKFRRQQGIGPYVLDFYCPELRLCVELDGSSHDYKYEYDEQRTEFLQNQGIRVLRFSNEQVWQGLDFVVDEIVRVGRLIKDDADFLLSP